MFPRSVPKLSFFSSFLAIITAKVCVIKYQDCRRAIAIAFWSRHGKGFQVLTNRHYYYYKRIGIEILTTWIAMLLAMILNLWRISMTTRLNAHRKKLEIPYHAVTSVRMTPSANLSRMRRWRWLVSCRSWVNFKIQLTFQIFLLF